MAPFSAVVSEYPFLFCALNNAGGQMASVESSSTQSLTAPLKTTHTFDNTTSPQTGVDWDGGVGALYVLCLLLLALVLNVFT